MDLQTSAHRYVANMDVRKKAYCRNWSLNSLETELSTWLASTYADRFPNTMPPKLLEIDTRFDFSPVINNRQKIVTVSWKQFSKLETNVHWGADFYKDARREVRFRVILRRNLGDWKAATPSGARKRERCFRSKQESRPEIMIGNWKIYLFSTFGPNKPPLYSFCVHRQEKVWLANN